MSPSVVLLKLDDGSGRLIDLDGRAAALSPSAACFLEQALRSSFDKSTDAIVRRYALTREQAADDLGRLLRQLRAAGFLVAVGNCCPAAASFRWAVELVVGTAVRSVHHLGCTPRAGAVLIALAWISVRLLGWSGAVAVWGQWCGRCKSVAASPDQIDALVRPSSAASFTSAACKERALCSWSLLKRHALPARLFVGVAVAPLELHAWCQCEAAIVGDDAERCQRYAPIWTAE